MIARQLVERRIVRRGLLADRHGATAPAVIAAASALCPLLTAALVRHRDRAGTASRYKFVGAMPKAVMR
jgi:hypothetical protein